MNTTIYPKILSDKSTISLQLPHYVRNTLVESFKVINSNPYTQFDEIIDLAHAILFRELNLGVQDCLTQFSAQSNKQSVLLLRGLPTSLFKLPYTPTNDMSTNGKDYLSELIMLGLCKFLKAIPFINFEEKDGRIFQQVIPLEGKENEESGTGSATPFSEHSENCHASNPPDYFFLYCLRGNENAITTYYPVEELISACPQWVVEALTEKDFRFKTGPSYNVPSEIIESVLTHVGVGNYEIRYNSSPSRLEGLTTQAKKALEWLRNLLKDGSCLKGVCLENNDLLIIKNKKTLHGRKSFPIGNNPNERRWLQRLYLIRSQPNWESSLSPCKNCLQR